MLFKTRIALLAPLLLQKKGAIVGEFNSKT